MEDGGKEQVRTGLTTEAVEYSEKLETQGE